MKLCMGCMTNIDDNITTCPHCGYDETTLRQESYYLDPGTVVGGKYIVGRVISYGGYTITYLGMDAENNRKVMVKEYLPSDFSTRSDGETEVTIYSGDAVEQFEQGLTTFLNEANRIQHLENVQGIAKVYDCVAENDTGYVISEYVEGQTLKEILESGRTFTPQEAKDFISQILVGLSQVHPMDIIHCDISPETIMVTNTGEIKLMDFGATRYVTTANSKSLAIILKQGYAPEEQYRSKGVRGPWTDVYALGAVMYRMITGKVPTESVDRALIDELKEPSKLGVAIPQNIENAMMNALNVYQKDRTPSAEVFLQELNSPQVKRIQVKKKKNDTGKFPKWAKGLVAGLMCVVLAGGAFIAFNMNSNEKSGGGDEECQNYGEIKGKSLDKFKDYWKNNLKLSEDDLSYVYLYDKDDKKAEGTFFNIIQKEEENSVIIDGHPVSELKDAEKNGKLHAFVYVKSSRKFSFKENWLSFFPDVEEAKRKLEYTDDRTKPYGTIQSIIYDGRSYNPNVANDRKELLQLECQADKGLQFNLYTGNYYVCTKENVEKISEGKNIYKLPVFELWGIDSNSNDKDAKRLKEKVIPENIISRDYYSFTKEEGYITKIDSSFKVMENEKAYDQSKSESDSGEIFHVVGNKFGLKELTVRELRKKGLKLKIIDEATNKEVAGKDDYIISGCEEKYFTAEDTVTLSLEKPVVTPEPTAEPTSAPSATRKPSVAKRPGSAYNEGAVLGDDDKG